MEAIIALSVIYIALYLMHIVRLSIGFSRVKTFTSSDVLPNTTFSIIVPFRNEAENLPILLESIRNINYPKALFEVIFIDDFSEDESEKIVYRWRMENGEFNITLIESVRIASPKKDAIMRAVPIATGQWIVTTDADCILPTSWLSELNYCILNNDVSMIAGPIIYNGKNLPSHWFQKMDLLALQGATIGGFGLGKPFMCNGANFAYSKKLFAELGGFAGNEKSASGDDVFLLQKAVAKKASVCYLKSKKSIVVTKPVNSWPDLFYQRVRWASKAGSYENEFAELTSWTVFLGNICLLILFAFCIRGFFCRQGFVLIFGLKYLVDLVLMVQANRFLYRGKFFLPFLSSLVYPFFTVAVALYSVVGKYRWKGRILT